MTKAKKREREGLGYIHQWFYNLQLTAKKLLA